MSFKYPDIDGDKFLVWLHISYKEIWVIYTFIMHHTFSYIVIISVYVISTIGFLTYVYNSVIKKNNSVLKGMLSRMSRYHFIPLIFIIANFILGETRGEDLDVKEGHALASLIITVLSLISLLYISYIIKLNSSFSKEMIVIKSGLSCFIAFLTYYLGYIIWLYKSMKDINDGEYDLEDWNKETAIWFSIVIGLANCGISIFLIDPVVFLI